MESDFHSGPLLQFVEILSKKQTGIIVSWRGHSSRVLEAMQMRKSKQKEPCFTPLEHSLEGVSKIVTQGRGSYDPGLNSQLVEIHTFRVWITEVQMSLSLQGFKPRTAGWEARKLSLGATVAMMRWRSKCLLICSTLLNIHAIKWIALVSTRLNNILSAFSWYKIICYKIIAVGIKMKLQTSSGHFSF